MTNQKPTFSLSEDWTVVVFGFLIIGLYLLGFKIQPPSFGWSDTSDLFGKVLTIKNLTNIFALFLLVYVIAILASVALGKGISSVAKGFPIVYILTVIALILAGNTFLKNWNLEAVIFSLSIGLAISNFFTVPLWLKNALSTELYVKIGLVLLGSSIIFGDILKAGSLGFIQALLVVVAVWYFAFWLCKKMGIDEELSIIISSAVSICGVSAAIASAGAIKGDSKKLSYVISVVLITAIPMIIFMPFIANMLGLSQAVSGAWLGGTIDTTGAVIASGSL
ncbi:MAG: putative sulfate exporter family transporter, partial [Saprospiraceae bacterium]|nr:putative sulfate exporter family transporter [Saprospiraceae bacterium]